MPWAEGNYHGAVLYARLLPLPDGVCGREWDRALVRPVSGLPPFRVGHFLVVP